MNTHVIRPTPTRLAVLLIILVAVALAAVGTLSVRAVAAATSTSCNAFIRHDETSWYKAQQYLNALPSGYTSTALAARDLLDADRDGYACEHLAVVTAALGEPSCAGDLWWRDCSGRDMFRRVTTSPTAVTPVPCRARCSTFTCPTL